MSLLLAVLTRLRRFPWDSIIPWQVIAQAQGVGALAFTGIWAMYYVPEQWRAVFFAAVACGLFAGSLRRADFYIPAAACAGIALLLLVILPPVAQGWLALTLCIVGFELTRSASEQGRISAKSFPRILAIAMAATGLQLGTRLTYEKHSNLLTVFWAIFALTILILGIVRRERVYRRAGLGVLGLAVGAFFSRMSGGSACSGESPHLLFSEPSSFSSDSSTTASAILSENGYEPPAKIGGDAVPNVALRGYGSFCTSTS